MAARDPTGPPSDLDGESKRLWRKVRKQLQDQGTWQDSDVGVLERYIRAVERGRRARKGIRGELLAEGSQGQLVQHPNLKTAREADQDAHRYAEALILTPEARKRHGIEPAAGPGKFGDL